MQDYAPPRRDMLQTACMPSLRAAHSEANSVQRLVVNECLGSDTLIDLLACGSRCMHTLESVVST